MTGNGNRPIGVDLFAGAGGLSLGFEQAGFDVAAAVEYDPVHCATHEFNFPDCAAICRSVADIGAAFIRRNSRIGDQNVDVVFGGAPCQGFSMIGKRALDDPRNALVHHFVRLVVELKASYFVFENVRGLTQGPQRKFLEEIISEFLKNGYRVVEDYRVLNASHHGVPQDRQRLFLMGARKGLRLPEYPRTTHEPPNGADGAASLFLDVTPTVWDALKDLPEADDFEELLERDWVKARFKKPTEYSAPLRGDSAEPSDYSIPREFDGALLTSSLRTIHTELSRKRFQETKPGDTERVSRFHKLDPKGICNTIRAGRSQGHLQYHSRWHGQRSRRIYLTPPDPPVLAALHHRSGGCPASLLPRLVSLPRNEMARLPADRQLRSATVGARSCREGARGDRRPPAALRTASAPWRSGLAIVWHGGSRGQIRRAAGRYTKANPCAG